jgi:hypothetical protein
VSIIMSLFILKTSNQGLMSLNITSTILLLSGSEFTLYSRVHLVIPPGRTGAFLLRGLLIMVIVTAFLFNIAPVVATILELHGFPSLGSQIYNDSRYVDFGYAGQDVLLSLMYIYFCKAYVEEVPVYSDESEKRRIRAIIWQLVAASIIVLISNVVTLVLLCKKMLLARYTLNMLVFALKLKVEVFVLTQLVNVSNLKREIMARGNLNASWSNSVREGEG